jgi:hypothetical protein
MCTGAMAVRASLAMLLAAFLLSACGGSDGAEGETGEEVAETDRGPDSELVAWMDDFCDARWSLDLPAPPTAPSPITEADRQRLLDVLADTDAALAAAVAAVDALPASPVVAGDDMVDRYRADLEEFRSSMAEYAEHAGVFPVPELGAVYRLSAVDLASWAPAGVDELVEGNADLTEAYQAATACTGGG